MELTIANFLPPAVAACQNVGLFGLVVVVAVTSFAEIIDWWADQ